MIIKELYSVGGAAAAGAQGAGRALRLLQDLQAPVSRPRPPPPPPSSHPPILRAFRSPALPSDPHRGLPHAPPGRPGNCLTGARVGQTMKSAPSGGLLGPADPWLQRGVSRVRRCRLGGVQPPFCWNRPDAVSPGFSSVAVHHLGCAFLPRRREHTFCKERKPPSHHVSSARALRSTSGSAP